jgi:hypothetical protein
MVLLYCNKPGYGFNNKGGGKTRCGLLVPSFYNVWKAMQPPVMIRIRYSLLNDGALSEKASLHVLLIVEGKSIAIHLTTSDHFRGDGSWLLLNSI